MQRQHAVITGAGLGGLTTALILARHGWRVTVLEQQPRYGGCLQTFTRRGTMFETGMHFTGSMMPGQIMGNVLEWLGVAGKVTLSRLDTDGYDVINLRGSEFAIANGTEAFVGTLGAHFPSQKDGLHNYIRTVTALGGQTSLHTLDGSDNLGPMALSPYATMADDAALATFVTDPVLRDVLAGQSPLYGGRAGITPFMTHAFISNFYHNGAWRFAGGSGTLAGALVREIEGAGGQMLTSSRVTAITGTPQRATGVEVNSSNHIPADVVISSMHPSLLAAVAAPGMLRPAWRKRIDSLAQTPAPFTVYIRFKPDTVPYMNHNYYGYDTSPWLVETSAHWPAGYLYMHMCDTPGQQWANGAVAISYMSPSAVQPWMHTAGPHRENAAYRHFCEDYRDALLQRLAQDHPGDVAGIDATWTSTPLTYRDYTGTVDGSMYGIEKTVADPAGCRVSHRTHTPNLLLTGQSTNSHGMLGVTVAAIVTAGQLLGKDTIYAGLRRTRDKHISLP